jgi:hypothetical protein
MLNLLGHKGNANENDTEISLHYSQNGYHQEYKQQQTLANMWGKRACFHTVVGM